MKPTNFWTLAGLVVLGWILVDMFSKPQGTSALFNGVTNLVQSTGTTVTGGTAPAPNIKSS
jgi:hypothetical protein